MAMKCFHDIKNNIKQRCRQEGSDEYQLNYIRPLVEQTRSIVYSQCSLSSPYIEYFKPSAAVSVTASSQSGRYRRRGWTSRTVAAVAWAIVVVLVVPLFVVGPTSATVSGLTATNVWYRRLAGSVRRPGLWCAFSDCILRLTASIGRVDDLVILRRRTITASSTILSH